jgi:peptidoglycan-associated lipoprotein
MKKFLSLSVLSAAIIVSGCSTTGDKTNESGGVNDELYQFESGSEPTEFETITVEIEEDESEQAFNDVMIDDEFNKTLDDLADDEIAQVRENQLVLFDFDSNVIKNAELARIQTQLSILSSNPNLRVMLEGRADERGTREYNVLLSERRALAVKDQLVEMGANPEQILYVGLGENEPLFVSEREDKDQWWSLNRSVYFKFIER